ncbi:hypothetical protein ACFWB2_14680 [Streptomyces virginiae]|uniref:hypothetical protein n=1 Tax=Streptomyces TaxID=1883 RepID=UPI00093AA11E|nr:hypothetical protein [Streptomyces sp. MJM1172]OKI67565.1 hypothetical protein AMK15_06235 [Streptomyces sp. MJM1172]
MGIWYCSREDVKSALDFKETARSDAKVDRVIESASRSIEALCHRRFYPTLATRRFDWPGEQSARPWRLWLGSNELISVSAMSSGSTVFTAGEYLLRRSDDLDEPPYTRVELDLNSSASFGGSTMQQAISVTGLFGFRDDEIAAGTVAGAIDTSAVRLDVTDSSAIGVGSLIRIGTERLTVTAKSQKDTGQNLQAPIGANAGEVTVAVSDGTAFSVGEVLLLDAERMLVVDIAGNNLIVKRNWDGSVLAAHTSTDIYAPRTLTVTRGVLGTTAQAVSNGASIARWEPPGPVRELCIAESLNSLQQALAGYARTAGSGDGERELKLAGLASLRQSVYRAYGRMARLRAV